jgi:circadian clock protein KaiC
MNSKVTIRRLPTGVPGLDSLLGGGLPEFSFNLIAGMPGSGKTTLAHQIMFSLAGTDCRALFFTVLGEPTLKMLRYQQQFTFFDVAKIDQSIRFVNLAPDILGGTYERVLARITQEVKDFSPSLVFVDSFRSVVDAANVAEGGIANLQLFVQQLGIQMTSMQATTFLIGEYSTTENDLSPVFTVADGILWLSQQVHSDSMVRKIQVVKMRSQALAAGLHTFRISEAGIEIFPRAKLESTTLLRPPVQEKNGSKRLKVGIPKLDDMLGGGLPAGYSLLLSGPSGSGKTVLAMQFLAEGVRQGESGVIAAFERSPNQYLSHKLAELTGTQKVGILETRSLDLSIDEMMHDLSVMIRQMNAKRVVIDSLNGFELALASEFRERFRESLYRMTSALTELGVSIVMTEELEDGYTGLRFSSYGNAFMADAILLQRYIELDSQLKRIISVLKVRGSSHSEEIRLYEVTDDGINIGERLSGYEGLLSGHPTRA